VMLHSYPAPCLAEALQDGSRHPTTAWQGLSVCEIVPVYCPRNPAESILYGVVAAELENFLARQRRRDRHVPRFVERELRSFLEGPGVRSGIFSFSEPVICRLLPQGV
jgi:hypothetical protein